MDVLVLDFDGVISDSSTESFVVALQTHAELVPGSRLAAALAELGPPSELTRERVSAHPLYGCFLEHMPLGQRAEDYLVILAALERDERLPDQEAFDRRRAELPRELLDRYHERFYVARRALARAHPEPWLALMSLYPEFLATLRRLAGRVALAIATAKDARSVAALLERYGAAELFAEAPILDKEAGRTKRAHLGRVREMLGIPYERTTFVDDKVSHLDAVAPLGVRCALAGWGFNGAREHELARARGYAVCSLDDFEARLFPEPAARV